MLKAHLLGVFRLSVDDRPLPGFGSRKAKSLFAYLISDPGSAVPREVLADRICGDRTVGDPRRAISQELWNIRSTLKKRGVDPDRYLVVDVDDIGFRADAPYWLDVEAFDKAIGDAAPVALGEPEGDAIGRLQDAVSLYHGDFLTGIYDDWCLFPREILRDRYLSALERLDHYHQSRHEWDLAIANCKRLLNVDGLLEHVHRDLMWCHYAKGNRPAALRQFQKCKRLLQRELGEEPMAETVELYQQIRHERPDGPARDRRVQPIGSRPASSGLRPSGSKSPLSDLYAVQGGLHSIEHRVSEMIREIKRA